MSEKQQPKVNSSSELYRILSNEEEKKVLPPNIFVKRKRPQPVTKIIHVV